MLWNLRLEAKSLPKKETEKPTLKKLEKTHSSTDNGMDYVLERPKKVDKPVLKKKAKEETQTRKIDKALKKSNSSDASVLDFKNSSSLDSSQKNTEKKKLEKKESFPERRKRLNLERLKAEARSNHHKVIPEPAKPYFKRKRHLDNEPSVYESVMDERRAEGRGYGGAR